MSRSSHFWSLGFALRRRAFRRQAFLRSSYDSFGAFLVVAGPYLRILVCRDSLDTLTPVIAAWKLVKMILLPSRCLIRPEHSWATFFCEMRFFLEFSKIFRSLVQAWRAGKQDALEDHAVSCAAMLLTVWLPVHELRLTV